MTRYAVYARYSSDHQSERSIDDQVALCSKQIGDGDQLVEVFSDYAISGAHAKSRPGLVALMAAASEGRFDIALAEALDRISRDQEDIAHVYKQLDFAGVRLLTVAEGAVNELHIGLKGTMNALFLKDLAQKVRRGQSGRVTAGRIPGGICYGYEAVRQLDERGDPIKGMRRIVDEQAEIVREIFDLFALGKSARAIAKELNRRGVPGPRGGDWQASAIYGNAKRQNGIIHNELYRGTIVYNRQRFVKDPATGKRQARANPRDEWQRQDVPELRIVTDEQWARAHVRFATVSAKPPQHRKRGKHLLSGLAKCQCCGASYTVYGTGRLRCASRMNKGTCDNPVTIAIDELERRVLDAIQGAMLDEELIAEFARTFHDEVDRRRSNRGRERRHLEKKAAQIQRRIDGCLDAIEDGARYATVKARMEKALEEQDRVAAELEGLGSEPVVILKPNVDRIYRRKVEQLRAAVRGDEIENLEAREIVRSMIERVVIFPKRDDNGRAIVEIEGDLATLLLFASGNEASIASCMESVVAGVGFEPTTFRL